MEASARARIVIFLDSDDTLHPEVAASVVAAWVDGCSKVQYRLSIIDEHGARTGAFPAANVPMPSGDVVPMIAEAGGDVTPVTSGNAYDRRVSGANADPRGRVSRHTGRIPEPVGAVLRPGGLARSGAWRLPHAA